MVPKLNKSLLSPLGMVLALCLFVGCQRARLEPGPRPTNQDQTQAQAPQAPSGQEQTQVPQDGPQSAPVPVSADPQTPPARDAGMCRPREVMAGHIVKVLFVVDASGSNFGQAGTVPSDADRRWRINTLKELITRHLPNPQFFFGLTVFQGTSAHSKINFQGVPEFSNNRKVVSAGFQSFVQSRDGGDTPYKAALKLTKKIIAADLQKNPQDQASYAVVMISDGHATDYKHVNEVIPDASAIKDLAPDRITLNSIYYSAKKVSATAPQYLKSIARIGEGAFIVANTHKVLNLDNAILISPRSCQ